MKKILITGKDSYIGESLEKWLSKEPSNYIVKTIDMKNESWDLKDFSQYDIVFHVAGIAHASSKKRIEKLYFKINRDLTIKTAQKAKSEGVRQFIFMSSMLVYDNKVNKKININTLPKPRNVYGLSKLQAEQEIRKLQSNEFKIVILRPPMIYGPDSKGNYSKLAYISKKIPFFPDFDNIRSMLYIDNLCEFVKLVIDNEEAGLFFPQNSEFVKTSELVKLISEANGNKIRMIKMFNPILKLVLNFDTIRKVFGNFYYDKSLSNYCKGSYRIRSFRESIELTERFIV